MKGVQQKVSPKFLVHSAFLWHFTRASVKKCFFLRKLTKMSNLILCFSKILKKFYLVRARQVALLSEDENFIRLNQCLLYDFLLQKWVEGKKCRKQTGSNASVRLNKVSAFEHDRFMQVSLYTVYCLMIICKYVSLTYKFDYEHSGLNTTNLFHCFNGLNVIRFSFRCRKKYLWEITMKEQIKQRDEAIIMRLGFLEQIQS